MQSLFVTPKINDIVPTVHVIIKQLSICMLIYSDFISNYACHFACCKDHLYIAEMLIFEYGHDCILSI
jgi:hypothetical protein